MTSSSGRSSTIIGAFGTRGDQWTDVKGNQQAVDYFMPNLSEKQQNRPYVYERGVVFPDRVGSSLAFPVGPSQGVTPAYTEFTLDKQSHLKTGKMILSWQRAIVPSTANGPFVGSQVHLVDMYGLRAIQQIEMRVGSNIVLWRMPGDRLTILHDHLLPAGERHAREEIAEGGFRKLDPTGRVRQSRLFKTAQTYEPYSLTSVLQNTVPASSGAVLGVTVINGTTRVVIDWPHAKFQDSLQLACLGQPVVVRVYWNSIDQIVAGAGAVSGSTVAQGSGGSPVYISAQAPSATPTYTQQYPVINYSSIQLATTDVWLPDAMVDALVSRATTGISSVIRTFMLEEQTDPAPQTPSAVSGTSGYGVLLNNFKATSFALSLELYHDNRAAWFDYYQPHCNYTGSNTTQCGVGPFNLLFRPEERLPIDSIQMLSAGKAFSEQRFTRPVINNADTQSYDSNINEHDLMLHDAFPDADQSTESKIVWWLFCEPRLVKAAFEGSRATGQLSFAALNQPSVLITVPPLNAAYTSPNYFAYYRGLFTMQTTPDGTSAANSSTVRTRVTSYAHQTIMYSLNQVKTYYVL